MSQGTMPKSEKYKSGDGEKRKKMDGGDGRGKGRQFLKQGPFTGAE